MNKKRAATAALEPGDSVVDEREIQRITLDLPAELTEAITKAASKKYLTKAQYMRMALDLMNVLTQDDGTSLIIEKKNGKRSQVVIPGVLSANT